ncbi:MAG: hypothetical protein WA885_06320 [Phormidesmis sp.]
MTVSSPTRHSIKPWLASGLMFLLASLLFDINVSSPLTRVSNIFGGLSTNSKVVESLNKSCETEITDTARLSREQLLALLAVPERDSKDKIRQIVQEPYCQLSSLKIRAGVDAEREAYPLAFDPNTTLVILYENDEYAGYRFKY